MLQNNQFLRTSLSIIAVLVILYLGSKVMFLFAPFLSILQLMLVPMMLSGFFFYLLRPLVRLLEKYKVHRMAAILLIYLVFLGLFAAFSALVWPTLREQIRNFIDNMPFLVEDLQNQFNHLRETPLFARFMNDQSEWSERFYDYFNNAINWVTVSMTNLISVVSSVFIVLATLPIILYYMLKDGHKLTPILLNVLPKRFRKDGREMLDEIDTAMSNFIVTRVLLNVALGVLLYIGFLLIGLDYALLLAVVSVPLNFIPYVGSFLAGIPVVVVGFIQSPTMAIWSVVIIVIAQQIQDNLLSPVIYGKSLDIHPLTTVVLVLVGGDWYGIIGVLIALPVYMVLKIIVLRIHAVLVAEKSPSP